MPWMKDENDESKYVVSKYAKEELPTWDELYNQFYVPQVCDYNPNDPNHQQIDLYWNLPHRKLLLGWICNQLNKILYEDGQLQRVIDKVNKAISGKYNFTKVFFLLVDMKDGFVVNADDIADNLKNIDESKIPEIYTCEIPGTDHRSLFASDALSINIKCFTHEMMMVIGLDSTGMDEYNFIYPYKTPDIFWSIIKEIIGDTLGYFGGEFVGWKDDNGNPLEDNSFKPGCDYQSGSDAGL